MDSLKAGRKTDLLEILNLSDLETVGYNIIKNYFSAYNGEIFEINVIMKHRQILISFWNQVNLIFLKKNKKVIVCL